MVVAIIAFGRGEVERGPCVAEIWSAGRSIAGKTGTASYFGLGLACGRPLVAVPAKAGAQIINISPPTGSAYLHHLGLEPARTIVKPIQGRHSRASFGIHQGIPISLPSYSVTFATFISSSFLSTRMLNLVSLFLILISPAVESALVTITSGNPALVFSKEHVLDNR